MDASAEAAVAPQQNQINLEQAVNLITEALEKGNRAGAFSLKEAQTVTSVWESLIQKLSGNQEEK